jgi:hypothetical protein
VNEFDHWIEAVEIHVRRSVPDFGASDIAIPDAKSYHLRGTSPIVYASMIVKGILGNKAEADVRSNVLTMWLGLAVAQGFSLISMVPFAGAPTRVSVAFALAVTLGFFVVAVYSSLRLISTPEHHMRRVGILGMALAVSMFLVGGSMFLEARQVEREVWKANGSGTQPNLPFGRP